MMIDDKPNLPHTIGVTLLGLVLLGFMGLGAWTILYMIAMGYVVEAALVAPALWLLVRRAKS